MMKTNKFIVSAVLFGAGFASNFASAASLITSFELCGRLVYIQHYYYNEKGTNLDEISPQVDFIVPGMTEKKFPEIIDRLGKALEAENTRVLRMSLDKIAGLTCT